MRLVVQVVVVVAAVLFVLPVALADPPADCSISVQCCNASAGTCDLTSRTCTCTFSCGPKEKTCSCSCKDKSTLKPTVPKVGFSALFTSSAGISLNGVDLNLNEVGILLQNYYNWNVNVDTDVASINVGDMYFDGTFEGLLDEVAAVTNTAYAVDTQTTTITFHD